MLRLAETLNNRTALPDALRILTDGAVEAIPGADFASISVRQPDGKLDTLAATDPFINELDAQQYDLQEGPCYDTVTQQAFYVGFDLARDERWPRYGPIAVEGGNPRPTGCTPVEQRFGPTGGPQHLRHFT